MREGGGRQNEQDRGNERQKGRERKRKGRGEREGRREGDRGGGRVRAFYTLRVVT